MAHLQTCKWYSVESAFLGRKADLECLDSMDIVIAHNYFTEQIYLQFVAPLEDAEDDLDEANAATYDVLCAALMHLMNTRGIEYNPDVLPRGGVKYDDGMRRYSYDPKDVSVRWDDENPYYMTYEEYLCSYKDSKYHWVPMEREVQNRLMSGTRMDWGTAWELACADIGYPDRHLRNLVIHQNDKTYRSGTD